MNSSDQITRVAKKLVWWEEPAVALQKRSRFLMQVMTMGTWQDVQIVRDVFGWEAFREALLGATPGIFDKRSWIYWHAVFGLPEREMPRRSLT